MIHLQELLIAMVAAAGAAYLGNRVLQALWGDHSVYTTVPWWEEACKTGAAMLTGAPIVAVHTAFGITELLYDLLHPSFAGFLLGSLSLFGHLAFGTLTWAVADWTGALWAGYVAASIAHMAWNRVMIRLLANWQAPGVRGGPL